MWDKIETVALAELIASSTSLLMLSIAFFVLVFCL